MNVITNLEKKTQIITKNEISEFTGANLNALVIEDDYVGYLFLNEILSLLKINVFRAVSFDEAFKESLNLERIDLLIVNISHADNTTFGIKYLRQALSAPILLVDDTETKSIKYQDIVDKSDGVIGINADANCFVEIISDVLKNSSPVIRNV